MSTPKLQFVPQFLQEPEKWFSWMNSHQFHLGIRGRINLSRVWMGLYPRVALPFWPSATKLGRPSDHQSHVRVVVVDPPHPQHHHPLTGCPHLPHWADPPSSPALHCHGTVSCDHVIEGRGRSAFTLMKRTCLQNNDAFLVSEDEGTPKI